MLIILFGCLFLFNTRTSKPKQKAKVTVEKEIPQQCWCDEWPDALPEDSTAKTSQAQIVTANLFFLVGTTTIDGVERNPREVYESIQDRFAQGRHVKINEAGLVIRGTIVNTWEEDGWIKGKILLNNEINQTI